MVVALDDAVAGWGGDRYVAWDDLDGSGTCLRATIIGDTPDDTAEIRVALDDWAANAALRRRGHVGEANGGVGLGVPHELLGLNAALLTATSGAAPSRSRAKRPTPATAGAGVGRHPAEQLQDRARAGRRRGWPGRPEQQHDGERLGVAAVDRGGVEGPPACWRPIRPAPPAPTPGGPAPPAWPAVGTTGAVGWTAPPSRSAGVDPPLDGAVTPQSTRPVAAARSAGGAWIGAPAACVTRSVLGRRRERRARTTSRWRRRADPRSGPGTQHDVDGRADGERREVEHHRRTVVGHLADGLPGAVRRGLLGHGWLPPELHDRRRGAGQHHRGRRPPRPAPSSAKRSWQHRRRLGLAEREADGGDGGWPRRARPARTTRPRRRPGGGRHGDELARLQLRPPAAGRPLGGAGARRGPTTNTAQAARRPSRSRAGS